MADDIEEPTAPRGRGRRSRADLQKTDLQTLMLSAPFKRFIYCVLMESNLLRGGYGANQATLQWWEGRRSLGLDILATLQSVDPQALLAVLTEETKTQLETTNGTRRTDRRTELDGDPDGNVRSDGLAYLDYGADGSDLRQPAD